MEHIRPCPEEAVTCLVLDGNFLYSGSEDKTIKVWDVAGAVSGRSLASMCESGGGGGGGGGGGTRTVYSSSSSLVKTLTGHTDAVVALQMLRMTGHLLSIAVNGTLLVWDPNGKGTIMSKFEHPERFRCMAVRERDNQAGLSSLCVPRLSRHPTGSRAPAPTSARPCTPPLQRCTSSTFQILVY